IRVNYQTGISLQDAADELYLSPTYLSKYIRKSCGRGFVDLINSVRLSHAVEALMYTDDPIIKIAMDNGFASVAALNKVFRDTYHTTPSVYRKENKKTRNRGEDMKKTAACLHRFAEQGNPVRQKRKEKVLMLPADEYRTMTLENLMNAGQASDIMKVSTQERILYCKRELGIRYVRFWNVFTEEMHMNRISRTGQRNYGKLDEILDFLVKQKLIPYIELRPRAVRLLQTANKAIHEKEGGEGFRNSDEMTFFFRDFFTHLLRRYGHVEVSEWVFSYSIESDTKFEDESFTIRLMDEPLWDRYLREFDIVAEELKRRFPDARVGGPGFTVQHVSEDNMKKFLACWKSDHHLPDFISMT
ncbi:MAG: helix-turn-helix domain-containing protein, partial [Clostridiales bacterium]|nr:helix-turn-helix domain-containing protein [Clostridiales bacterium]